MRYQALRGHGFLWGCGYQFGGRPSTEPARATAQATVRSGSNHLATFAGLSWLLAAAATSFLAFQQWEGGALLASLGQADEGLRQWALFNGIAAALTAYFGARCLGNPSRGFLGTCAAWGALNVVSGIYQVVNGATYWQLYVIFVLTGLAGVLSYSARPEAPDPPHETRQYAVMVRLST